MGLIRFAVHPVDLFREWPEVYSAYLTGADGRIFPTRVEIIDNVIECRRSTSESVKLNIVWPVEGYGRIMISTASLPENDAPYLLPVELARGKIVQLRNQAATWEHAGLIIPEEFAEPRREAHRLFSRSASSQDRPEESSALAQQALVEACRASEILTRSYADQALEGRLLRFGTLPVSMGCEIGGGIPTGDQTPLFSSLFNAAIVDAAWSKIEAKEGEHQWEAIDRQVEWCEQQKLMVLGGPLLDLGPNGLPEWLSRWESDLFNLQSLFCDFVETVITRYVGRIRIWEICTRANTGGVLTLNEENRLTLVARVLDVARQVDEEAQLILRIDQPWGDYQSRGLNRLSPLQMVDALVRSGVGLNGVNLELAMGYSPRGSAPRDLFECSRLIDIWTMLDVPIYVTPICPSLCEVDKQADPEIAVNPRCWDNATDEQHQAEWTEKLVELLVAKPRVAGVFFPHFSDQYRHEFPHAGLVRNDGTSKPVVERILSLLSSFRRQY